LRGLVCNFADSGSVKDGLASCACTSAHGSVTHAATNMLAPRSVAKRALRTGATAECLLVRASPKPARTPGARS